MPPVLCP